jgi:hypothetical protein
MKVTYALINMRVELGMVKKEQLDYLAEDSPQRNISAPMRMEIRSILKSLRVKSTIPKLQER